MKNELYFNVFYLRILLSVGNQKSVWEEKSTALRPERSWCEWWEMERWQRVSVRVCVCVLTVRQRCWSRHGAVAPAAVTSCCPYINHQPDAILLDYSIISGSDTSLIIIHARRRQSETSVLARAAVCVCRVGADTWWVTLRICDTDRQTDRHQTNALRLPLLRRKRD